ncbi:MAG TPA: hypothetical protein VHM67_07900 [Gemmatimonadaceae bacterium]|nr:hypothetical protein [Gemmatimonadaceae bacterium]
MLRGPRSHDDIPDQEIAEVLGAFATPPGDGYWPALEQRIMQRITDDRAAWVTVLEGWVRPAAVVAATLVVAAALVLGSTVLGDDATAYAAVGEEQISALDSAGLAASNDPAVAVRVVFEP